MCLKTVSQKMKNDLTGGTVDQVSSAIKEGDAVFYLLQVELDDIRIRVYLCI